MKTLKELKKESEQFYTENARTYFAPSFSKKMGGTALIIFEEDFIPAIKIDKREYYSGRGAKYNSPSMHEHLDRFVSKTEFKEKVNSRAKMLFDREKEKKAVAKKLSDFCKLHGLNKTHYSFFSETMGVYFDPNQKKAIEKELCVDLTDFMASTGKTYYFTDSKIGRLCFYHNHQQSFSFTFAENEQEFVNNRESWNSGRYLFLLKSNPFNMNLYVC